MTGVVTSILHAIGHTPLVQLTRVVPPGAGGVRELGSGKVVATVVVDSGQRYLTGDLFQAAVHPQKTA